MGRDRMGWDGTGLSSYSSESRPLAEYEYFLFTIEIGAIEIGTIKIDAIKEKKHLFLLYFLLGYE